MFSCLRFSGYLFIIQFVQSSWKIPRRIRSITIKQEQSTDRNNTNTFFRLRGIGKQFGGVSALEDVEIELSPGQIHGLVGENGAGKSTLVNIATGVLQPDAGEIIVDGRPVRMGSPTIAAEYGVIAVHQEADLFEELSLAENMLLGHGLIRNRLGLIDWKSTYSEANAELGFLEEDIDVRETAGRFSIGKRVIAEIAAAVARKPKVLFLDEPTASLTGAESKLVFRQIAELKSTGVSIIYISHRLEEVLEICDSITVLRDGRNITTEPADCFDMDSLVSQMVGRRADTFYSREHSKSGEVVFEVENLSCPEKRFKDIAFNIRSGEIVGMYGLVGSGRSEMAGALFALEKHTGLIRLNGDTLEIKNPTQAAEAGLAYVSEDRLTEGIFANHSCSSNITSAILREISTAGVISSARENKASCEVIEGFAVKLDDPAQPINTLSGGNQQKLVLGRWLQRHPEVLILDEPTRGVDVGAKVEIHRLIDKLAGEGMAILLISSELPEVMRMSDRVLVMCQGKITGQFDPEKDNEDTVASAAFPKADEKHSRHFARQYSKRAALLQFRELGIVTAIVMAGVFMSVVRPDEFATLKNIIDVLTSASILSVGAAGMTLVIITGGIDISVGSMLGLVGASAGLAAMNGLPPFVCLSLALGMGVIFAAINSILSTMGKIHPIIVTLAGISIYRGIMLQVTGGYEVPLPDGYRALTDGLWLSIPGVLWFALAVLALNWLFINYTLTGRRLLAVGNSVKAAKLIGLSPWKLRLVAFVIMGALIGLASVMWGGYYGKIQSNTGLGWELQVIAAAVIGGCSIMGGKGTAFGAFLGAVLIALIYNILIILKISSYWQNLFVGTLILAAVLTDIWIPRILTLWQRKYGGQSS